MKGKHSSFIQESGPRQAGWADALSCLAGACNGATPLTALASIGAGAKWRSLEWDQPGVGPADGAAAVEARGALGRRFPLPCLCSEQTRVLSLPRPGFSEPRGWLELRTWHPVK